MTVTRFQIIFAGVPKSRGFTCDEPNGDESARTTLLVRHSTPVPPYPWCLHAHLPTRRFRSRVPWDLLPHPRYPPARATTLIQLFRNFSTNVRTLYANFHTLCAHFTQTFPQTQRNLLRFGPTLDTTSSLHTRQQTKRPTKPDRTLRDLFKYIYFYIPTLHLRPAQRRKFLTYHFCALFPAYAEVHFRGHAQRTHRQTDRQNDTPPFESQLYQNKASATCIFRL